MPPVGERDDCQHDTLLRQQLERGLAHKIAGKAPHCHNASVHCRNPDLPPVEMLDQEVWAVPYEHTLQYYAEDLQQVCTSPPVVHLPSSPHHLLSAATARRSSGHRARSE